MPDWYDLSVWWDNLNIALQLVISVVAIYTATAGIATFALHTYKTLVYVCQGLCTLCLHVKSWWNRPSRLDRVERKIEHILTVFNEKCE